MNLLGGLRANRARSEQALASLADGKKIRVASDNPVGAQESLGLRQRLVRLAGFDRSAEAGRTTLSTIESVLARTHGLLTEARTLALGGASGLDDANTTRAVEVEALRDELLALANTSQSGRYLFGGTETTNPPFADDGTYSGNADEVQAPVDSDESVAATLSGSRVFADGGDLFAALTDLADALRNGQPADVAALTPALTAGLDHIAQLEGEIGTRMQRIDLVLERHGDEELALIDRISSIEDADLAEVVVAIQQTDLSINALSAAAGRVLGRSLFDYLG